MSSGSERQRKYLLFGSIAVIVILGGTLGFVYLSSVNDGNTISALKAQSVSANNKVAQDNTTISQLQNQINTDNATISQLQSQISTDKSAMTSMNNTIAYLQYLTHNSTTVIAGLNATIASDEATITALNSTIASDNATINSLNTTIASDKAEISMLQSQVATLTNNLIFWQNIGNGSDYAQISSNGVLTLDGYTCSNLQQVSDFNQTAWSLLSSYAGQLYVSGYASGNTSPILYIKATYPNGLGPFETSLSSYASATIPIGSSLRQGSFVPAIQLCNSSPYTETLSTYASFYY